MQSGICFKSVKALPQRILFVMSFGLFGFKILNNVVENLLRRDVVVPDPLAPEFLYQIIPQFSFSFFKFFHSKCKYKKSMTIPMLLSSM